MNHHTLPNGWRRVSLEDVAHIQTGLAIGRTVTDDPVKLPYLRVANVQDGYLNLTEIKDVIVSRNDAERFRLQDGDVLMTEGGDFDKLGRGCVWESPIPHCLHQNHVFAVRTVREKLLPQFFAYHAAGPIGRLYLLSCSKQSTNLASINSTQLKQMPVPVPPLCEQTAIASLLATWDKAIGQTEALIVEKERLKRGLMQKLFDATVRFRGFSEGWKSRHLGEVFDERREPGIENLPTLSVTIDQGVIPRDDIDKPVRSALEHSDHRLVRAGDIAYNMMRMWQGGCGIVAEDGLISPAYVACKPSKEIDSRYAHHMFHSPRMIYLFWAYSYGLTDDRRRLYYEEFARIPVLLPPLKEQKKIAAFIDTVDMEIAQLKQNRDALKKQKRGLMQQLLTGKLRIPEKLIKKAAKS